MINRWIYLANSCNLLSSSKENTTRMMDMSMNHALSSWPIVRCSSLSFPPLHCGLLSLQWSFSQNTKSSRELRASHICHKMRIQLLFSVTLFPDDKLLLWNKLETLEIKIARIQLY